MTKVLVLKIYPQEKVKEIANEIYDRLARLGYEVTKNLNGDLEFTASINNTKGLVEIKLMLSEEKAHGNEI